MRALLIALSAICAALPSVVAMAQVPLEAGVKAAFIYRFLEYVTWPGQSFRTPDESLVIGTLQDDDVAAELVRIARDRIVQNRRLQVVHIDGRREPAVHVLYVARSNSSTLVKMLETLRQRPILVVTDLPDGLDRGGVINFVRVDDRIRFEVSLETASRIGLEISSRLLAVAVRVKKGEYPQPVYARRALAEVLALVDMCHTAICARAVSRGRHTR